MTTARRLAIPLALGVLLVLLLVATGEWAGWFSPVERDGGEAVPSERIAETPATDDASLRGTGEPVAEGAPPPPVDLEAVDRNRDLHGVVVDGEGRPVAGAWLNPVYYPWRRMPSVGETPRTWFSLSAAGTYSARDGTFRLRLAPHASCCLGVTKEGFAPLELTDLHAGERVRIVLGPAVAVRVRVYDELGRPVADCPLRLFRPPWMEGFAYTCEGETNADGEHLFADLPPGGTARLEASPTHLGSPGWVEVEVPASGEVVQTIELPAGRTIRGRVVDAATQAPLSGARVGIGSGLFKAVTTDADGRYVLEGWVEKGPRFLYAEADGHARAQERVLAQETIDFALPPECELLGRVVDADGAPPWRAYVTAIAHVLRPDLSSEVSTASEWTTTDGRFSLHGLRLDLPHRLVVDAEGHGRVVREIEPLGSGEFHDLGDIVLPPARTITGFVFDADGSSAARHVVALEGPDPPPRSPTPRPPDYGRMQTTHADDRGRFAFPDLSPGRYLLRATSTGGAAAEVEVVVPPDADVEGVGLRLPALASYVVRVEDDAGEGVEGVIVQTLLVGGGYGASRPTDASGEAAFEMEQPPAFVVFRMYGDLAARFAPVSRQPWPSGETTLVVRLERAVVVAGRLTDEDGKPVPLAEVQVVQGDATQRVWTGSAGLFSVSLASAEDVELVVTGIAGVPQPGGRPRYVRKPFEARLAVTPPRTDLVVVARALPADRTLSIRVLDLEGEPVEGARLGFLPGLRLPVSPLLTNTDGRAHVEGLDARPFDVHAYPPESRSGLAPAKREAVVAEGQEIVFRLAATVRVTLHVIGPDGAPVASATVRVVGAGGIGGTTSEDGTFSLGISPHSMPAVIEAVKRVSDEEVWTGRVEGVDADHAEVTIHLSPQ